jgi:hypothetical protein
MQFSAGRSVHTFHIPVMGTGYTIDTALHVAKYGISSVLSLVDDTLVEQMRRFHCGQAGEPYEEIRLYDEDSRARRITAYLNLLDRLVARQVAEVRDSRFEPDSEITRYFRLLPDSPLRSGYLKMLACHDSATKAEMQSQLRPCVVPGSIDVNIMSKMDRDVYRDGKKLPAEYCDAMAALRGYANSTLRSSVIFSAGMNPRLFSYAASFDDFFPDAEGQIKKKIVLKVSDYRSAAIQGKVFAKKGLWVSEYRIESGLNCGGHAFATQGNLMGPILEEFKANRVRLAQSLHRVYQKALTAAGRTPVQEPHEVRITVQGGIGTAAENDFLMRYYEVDGTGWATPFLLVPETTNVDREHLLKLAAATDDDVVLSESSPLGIPFWNLRHSASEEARRERIREGNPGSACPKAHARFNADFTDVPICVSSRSYQKRKLVQLESEDVTQDEREELRDSVTVKSCICHDLAGGATIKNGIDEGATPAVCPGPGIVDFSKIATLEEMVGHILGRLSLLTNTERPHMFVRELKLYVDHLGKETEKLAAGLSPRSLEYLCQFKENLLDGIEYYRELAEEFVDHERQRFLHQLADLRESLEPMLLVTAEC